MGATGFEPSRNPKQTAPISESRGNKGGNTGPTPDASTHTPPAAALDDGLAALIAAWPSLDADARALVLAVVNSAARRGR